MNASVGRAKIWHLHEFMRCACACDQRVVTELKAHLWLILARNAVLSMC